MKNTTTAKRRVTPNKKRDINCYNRKIAKIMKWHSRLIALREKPQKENPNTNLFPKRRELMPLEHYIDKIRKPSN